MFLVIQDEKRGMFSVVIPDHKEKIDTIEFVKHKPFLDAPSMKGVVPEEPTGLYLEIERMDDPKMDTLVIRNAHHEEFFGDVMIYDGVNIRSQKKMRISSGCSELYFGAFAKIDHQKALQRVGEFYGINSDMGVSKPLTEDQLWWMTFIDWRGTDHWPHSDQQDGSGRRMFFPFPIIPYIQAVDQGLEEISDGIAHYIHTWTLEQLAKRPDGFVNSAEGEAPFWSWRGYTQSTVHNLTVDLLFADVIVNNSRLAFERIEDILSGPQVTHALVEDEYLTTRELGNIIQAFALYVKAAQITRQEVNNSLVPSILNKFQILGDEIDLARTSLFDLSILLNACHLSRKVFSSAVSLIEEVAYPIARHFSQAVSRRQGPASFMWVDPLLHFGHKDTAKVIYDRLSSQKELPHHAKFFANRYMLRYCPYAMLEFGQASWASNESRFYYSREFPHIEQRAVKIYPEDTP